MDTIRSPCYPRQPPRVRGTPQLPSVPSLIPSSFATRAIGRDVSITIFTASSLNSGEKLFFGRGNYFTFPDVHPIGWTFRKLRRTPFCIPSPSCPFRRPTSPLTVPPPPVIL